MLRRSGWLAVVALMMACPPNIDTGEDAGADGPIVVTPEGGIFVRKGAVLNIPAGAVDADTTLFVTIVDTGIPDIMGRKRVSFGYRISPTSVKFNTPVNMTLMLPVIPDRVPKGVDPNTFDMRRQQGSDAFLQLFAAKTIVVPEGTAVQAQTERLGLFWVTSPSEATISRIEIDPVSSTVLVGKTQQFTARVISPTGEQIDVPVTWSVAPPRVGSIDANGLFTAKDPGRAVVTAKAGMIEATADVSVPGVTVGPELFTHENPFPTGNDLYGGAIAPAALGTVFAGANGTVLARTSTGVWQKLFSNPATRLYGVGGTTPQNAVAIGIVGDADLAQGALVEFKGTGMAPTVRTFSSVQPTQLWTDGVNGIAGGTGNDILVKKNGQWVTEGSPTFNDVLALTGNAQGGYTLLGSTGRVYRYDPARRVWDSLFQNDLAVLLQAATFVDEPTGEAWAIGGNKLWHFINNGWSSVNMPASPRFTVVRAMGAFDSRIFVAGEVNKFGTVLAYAPGFVESPDAGEADAGAADAGDADAGSTDAGDADAGATDAGDDGGVPPPVPPSLQWQTFGLRGIQSPLGFVSSSATGSEGYVTGTLGALWSWNASTGSFEELSKGFYGSVDEVVVLAADVIIAANECTSPACTQTRGTVRHRGSTGTWDLVGPQPFTGPITALAAKSATDIVAAQGVTTTGVIASVYHYDGTGWSVIPVMGGLAGDINDLHFCGSTLRGAGDKGAIYKGSPTLLNNDGSPTMADLQSFWCPTDSEFWVAGADESGTGFFATKTMNSAWSEITADGAPSRPWKAVWSPGQGEGFTFGQSIRGLYWNTVTLQTLQGLGNIQPEYVWDLWGSHFDNLYAVGLAQTPGRFGFALRHDGLNWSLIDSGSQRAVKSIDGLGDSNVWLGTEGGGVLKAVMPTSP